MRYLLISFMRKVGGQIDEMVSVSKRVRTSDLQSCNVILDFAEKKVQKCVIEGKVHDTTFEQMREYYAKIYPQLVTQLEREAPIDKGLAKLEAKIAPSKK
jgi:hypothetical protein